jgi:cellulose synthase/poly-beta-1,6-N-acetylglucosamine synthase-like glycosyltransferase
MSDSVRVSVVITAVDAQSGVEAALHSALASDLPSLEVIMVDNGPTNRSAIAVADVQDPRVVTVRVRPGRGTSRSRNVGIARARAPYVGFLDPDDLLKPDKLSATVNALDRYPEAGLAFSDFECIDASGTVIRPSGIAGLASFRTLASEPLEGSWRLIRQAHLARGLLYENFIATSGVVVRRQLLTEIGPFDEAVPCCADLDLWFRLAHRCDALYCSEVGHSRRDRSARYTSSTYAASKDCITVLRSERNRWRDRTARRQLDRLIAQKLANIAYDERRRRHRLRSSAMFAYAFATSPEVRWLSGMLRSILY